MEEKKKTYEVEVIEHISRFVICTVEASSEKAAREEALYGESTCQTVPHSESINDRVVWEVKAEGSEWYQIELNQIKKLPMKNSNILISVMSLAAISFISINPSAHAAPPSKVDWEKIKSEMSEWDNSGNDLIDSSLFPYKKERTKVDIPEKPFIIIDGVKRYERKFVPIIRMAPARKTNQLT